MFYFNQKSQNSRLAIALVVTIYEVPSLAILCVRVKRKLLSGSLGIPVVFLGMSVYSLCKRCQRTVVAL